MAAKNGMSKGQRTESERRELALKALQMRIERKPYDEIGAALGITPKRASVYVNQLQQERIVEGVDQYRATMCDEYDDLTRQLRQVLQDTGITVSQRLATLGQLASIAEKRVRLLGLAVPVKQVVELQEGGSEHVE